MGNNSLETINQLKCLLDSYISIKPLLATNDKVYSSVEKQLVTIPIIVKLIRSKNTSPVRVRVMLIKTVQIGVHIERAMPRDVRNSVPTNDKHTLAVLKEFAYSIW